VKDVLPGVDFEPNPVDDEWLSFEEARAQMALDPDVEEPAKEE